MDEPRMTGSAGARGWFYSRDSWPGARLLASWPAYLLSPTPALAWPSQYSSSRLQLPQRLKILLLLFFFKASFLLIRFFYKLTLWPDLWPAFVNAVTITLCKRDANLNLKSESPCQYSSSRPQPPWRLKILLLHIFVKASFLLIRFYYELWHSVSVTSIFQWIYEQLLQLHCATNEDANLYLKYWQNNGTKIP